MVSSWTPSFALLLTLACTVDPSERPTNIYATGAADPTTESEDGGSIADLPSPDADSDGSSDSDGGTDSEGSEGVDCETCGGDVCIDLDNDDANCGACANACSDGRVCLSGSCSCPDGLEPCAGECVDLDSNPDNCGGCASPCAANQVCAAGVCSDNCGALTECAGECIDLASDPQHCGACNSACSGSTTCEAGSCACPGDGISFHAEIEPLLADNCAKGGCHSFPALAAELDLSSGNAHAELVEVASIQCDMRMLVSPGAPDQSYLLDKLKGQNICQGKKMPKSAPAMSAAEIALISEWICRGALAD